MQVAYLVTRLLQNDYHHLHDQLCRDISEHHAVSQLFFYSDASLIGQAPEAYEALIELAIAHDIHLHLCSASFLQRQLTFNPSAQEDFNFRGLGQFIAESQSLDAIRCNAYRHHSARPVLPNANANLIAIAAADDDLLLTEYLDIALVSASYALKTILYISDNALRQLADAIQNTSEAVLKQRLNMLKEFNIPLFSDHKATLSTLNFQPTELELLLRQNKHCFILD